jgi:Tfp pilus assembly protein PilX
MKMELINPKSPESRTREKGGERMSQSLILKRIFKAGDQRGFVLVAGLMVVFVLTLLSLAAMMTTGTELKMAANDRSIKEAFYIAEAGAEEARSRLHASASTAPIVDNQPDNANWTVFIGTPQRSQQKGYDTTNSNQSRYDRLSSNLDYVVTISHKLDSSYRLLKWGDANNDGKPEENTVKGNNIYVITSEGYTSTGAVKAVRIESTRIPFPVGMDQAAALYTKEPTIILGTSTNVIGMGVPGIITKATVQMNGNPGITGNPVPIVEHSSLDIDVQAMINQARSYQNFSYDVQSANFTGMNWGSPTPGPTQQSPTSCNTDNIVYINTHNTYVKLSGQSSGCGLLLVEGDLNIHGGFQWYGVILVTGSVNFTGGGGKNVTGTILVGGTDVGDAVGGDANIIYSSQAVQDVADVFPLIPLRWAELFG